MSTVSAVNYLISEFFEGFFANAVAIATKIAISQSLSTVKDRKFDRAFYYPAL